MMDSCWSHNNAYYERVLCKTNERVSRNCLKILRKFFLCLFCILYFVPSCKISEAYKNTLQLVYMTISIRRLIKFSLNFFPLILTQLFWNFVGRLRLYLLILNISKYILNFHNSMFSYFYIFVFINIYTQPTGWSQCVIT